MEKPKVSVVMPAYNAASTLAQAVDSILAQSHSNWELVIVNDGSTDNTADIAAAYQRQDKRIRVINLPENSGLSAARNQGILNSISEWIAFLDSDDFWHPHKLNLQLNFHSANEGIVISHTNFIAFDARRKNTLPFRNLLISKKRRMGILYPTLCYQNTIGVLTVMVKRSVLIDVGMFDTSLTSLEDRDLWIRIAKQKYIFGYIPEVLASYRITEGGLSGRTGKYKKAYKRFIAKTILNGNLNEAMIWRYYYRYFGATYFKNREYKLSKLYFWKSIILVRFDFFSAISFLYLLYVMVVSFGINKVTKPTVK